MGEAQRRLSLYRLADSSHTIPQNGTEAIFYQQAIEVSQRSIWTSMYSIAAPENKNTSLSSLAPINDFMENPPHDIDNQKPHY